MPAAKGKGIAPDLEEADRVRAGAFGFRPGLTPFEAREGPAPEHAARGGGGKASAGPAPTGWIEGFGFRARSGSRTAGVRFGARLRRIEGRRVRPAASKVRRLEDRSLLRCESGERVAAERLASPRRSGGGGNGVRFMPEAREEGVWDRGLASIGRRPCGMAEEELAPDPADREGGSMRRACLPRRGARRRGSDACVRCAPTEGDGGD